MRNLIAAVSLSFMLSASAAFAQAQTPDVGAAAGAQHQMPDAVANPTINATPSGDAASSTSKNMPAEKIAPPVTQSSPAPKSSSTGMNVTKDSGGKIESTLVKDAPLSDDYVMGKSSAPVTMIEYASLSCPHCAHFSSAILPQLQKNYIDTGKVRYILRQFPLNEPALKGAMLLDCVGEQDRAKYYVFARVLFDAQSKWAFNGDWMSGLETIATVGGLSKDQFEHCVTSTDREMKVLKS
jgi:protein-disulfide isomerase